MTGLYEFLERFWVKASGLVLPIASSIVWPDVVGKFGIILPSILTVMLILHSRAKLENENIDRKIKQLQLENLEREAAHQRRKEDHNEPNS